MRLAHSGEIIVLALAKLYDVTGRCVDQAPFFGGPVKFAEAEEYYQTGYVVLVIPGFPLHISPLQVCEVKKGWRVTVYLRDTNA
jgi:hypothetical protein